MVNLKEIDRKIEELKSEIEKDFAQLISFKSVKSEPIPNFPFGKGIGLCLEEALQIGKRLGFETKNIDGYAGILSLGENDSDEYIGIFGHLDVVPEGSGWDSNPYELTKKDGRFYGRGVLDNKGPLLSTIYATKILKDLGVEFTKNIKIVMGTDEESGMSDIPYFLSKENAPTMGFTPDCKFPVVYGENGVLRLKVVYEKEESFSSELEKVEGEFSRASIPDYAKLILKNSANLEIVGSGKRAPANNPYLGENAIINALKNIPTEILEKLDFKIGVEEILKYLTDVYGVELGVNYKNKETGEVLVSFYNLQVVENKMEVFLSIRYPVDCDGDKIVETLKEKMSGEVTVEAHMAKVVFDKKLKMIEAMSKGYLEVTGLDSEPVTTTGGTYARKVPNIVAFGPSFPGEKGIAHNKNEYMDVDSFYKLIKIYALSIYYML